MGTVTAKDLAVKFGSIERLSQATVEELVSIDGIGDVVADGIIQYFKEEQNLTILQKLKCIGINPIYEAKEADGIFAGRKVVLTGSLSKYTRSQAAKIIEDNGGEISSTVSKTVNLVIAGVEAGSKLDKAKALNIEIIDEDTFIDILNTK